MNYYQPPQQPIVQHIVYADRQSKTQSPHRGTGRRELYQQYFVGL